MPFNADGTCVKQPGYPDDNPKTAIGVTKVPLHLVPPSAKHFLAEAFADGAQKYGPYNWREHKVSASVYYGALMRHMDAWWDGEDLASDSKRHHLGHAMACIAILIDAMTTGMLNDDRPLPGRAAALQREYSPTVKQEQRENDERTDPNTVEHSRLPDIQAYVREETFREYLDRGMGGYGKANYTGR